MGPGAVSEGVAAPVGGGWPPMDGGMNGVDANGNPLIVAAL
jgi:hypothetical protein